jgi:hypothetical protein
MALGCGNQSKINIVHLINIHKNMSRYNNYNTLGNRTQE